MTKDLESVWEGIAEEALRAAENVDCLLSEYAQGLHEIEIAIRERRFLVEDEVSHV